MYFCYPWDLLPSPGAHANCSRGISYSASSTDEGLRLLQAYHTPSFVNILRLEMTQRYHVSSLTLLAYEGYTRWHWFVLEFTSWLAYPSWIVKLDSDYSWAGSIINFLLLELLCGGSSSRCRGFMLGSELVERNVVERIGVIYVNHAESVNSTRDTTLGGHQLYISPGRHGRRSAHTIIYFSTCDLAIPYSTLVEQAFDSQLDGTPIPKLSPPIKITGAIFHNRIFLSSLFNILQTTVISRPDYSQGMFSFLSAMNNVHTDEYGGSFENIR
ncbi:uncharacterized protein HD556DRAFT_1342931 [Suillus plorans]|uniref:Uncharacterized protein n=1 Tax=Suillus plorans TaxID=116603 RepID=A0A9P7DQ28_9AGAM|nr:uncharacterized protein HD556DRAFT_1342931 [Suillus plorans]KAG1800365.1 hypothetical protein HD556DRAFT_1342931 [Suillus plorans]